MTGVCMVCGLSGEKVEQHHPAGRKSVPDITVSVCIACHNVLTIWQRERWEGERWNPVPSSPEAELLHGALEMLRLMSTRNPGSVVDGLPAILATALNRASGTGERRIFTGIRGETTPITPDPLAVFERAEAQRRFLVELLRRLRIPTLADLFTAVDVAAGDALMKEADFRERTESVIRVVVTYLDQWCRSQSSEPETVRRAVPLDTLTQLARFAIPELVETLKEATREARLS